LKDAVAGGDVEGGKIAALVLSKAGRDGQVQDILLAACHDSCLAAATEALNKRTSAVPFVAHMQGSFDALVAALQLNYSTASAIDRSTNRV
jgi:hypothetical protein